MTVVRPVYGPSAEGLETRGSHRGSSVGSSQYRRTTRTVCPGLSPSYVSQVAPSGAPGGNCVKTTAAEGVEAKVDCGIGAASASRRRLSHGTDRGESVRSIMTGAAAWRTAQRMINIALTPPPVISEKAPGPSQTTTRHP